MNIVGFLNGLFHWRTPEKMRKVTKTETSQEAAARALHTLAVKKASHK